jgi:hypothetical protein
MRAAISLSPGNSGRSRLSALSNDACGDTSGS